jgi:hypothetical protein
LAAYTDQIIFDYNESFPKPGDRMFVPSASGAHIAGDISALFETQPKAVAVLSSVLPRNPAGVGLW